jgi:hypothetical protein
MLQAFYGSKSPIPKSLTECFRRYSLSGILDSLIDVLMQPCHQRMRIEALDFMLAVADLARAVCPFEFCNNGGAT